LLVHYALVLFVMLFAVGERTLVWRVNCLRCRQSLGHRHPELSTVPRRCVERVRLSVRGGSGFPARIRAARCAGPGLGQRTDLHVGFVFPINAGGAFVFNSWQIFFVAGMLFGVTAAAQMASWKRISTRSVVVLVLLFAAACVVRAVIGGPDGAQLSGWRAYMMFDRKPLTVARVLYHRPRDDGHRHRDC